MLDNPEKTARLLAALKAAVPFEVDLTPAVVKQLQSEHVANADQIRRIVSDLHFSVSSARSLPKSVDVIGRGTVPRSASRAFIPDSARAAMISLLSRSTISAGTFLGPPSPTIKVAS